jgi:hypothetical protein
LRRLESGREYLYGYRVNEVGLKNLPEAKKSLKVGKSRVKRDHYNNSRPVLSANLPLCFTGATPPRPDPGHVPSVVAGIVKRFGYKPPPLSRVMKRRFVRFVSLWLKRNISPLTDSDIPTLEEWLERTSYSLSRKVELTEVARLWLLDPCVKLFHLVKSFIKDETYTEYKFPRAINSRVDSAKCYFGPIVQAVSDRLFSLPWFIKTVPVTQRPMVLRDTLLSLTDDEDYTFTDYTAFEAHFLKEVMDMTQVLLFKHMLSTSNNQEWLDNYVRIMTGDNKLQFKDVSCTVNATRMSGEMDTSLSNGFSNLMLFLFMANERGASSVKGFVEGDDGIFKVSPATATPTQEDFKSLGFTIKIGHTKELSKASFCGQVYDMDDLIVITDIREAVARLGWTNKRYVKARRSVLMQLLRARGYSYAYQYNGCPVLSKLGRRILELTAGVTISQNIWNDMGWWERIKLQEMIKNGLPEEREPGSATRSLVSELFHVSLEEQLQIEESIESMQLGFHEMPFSNIPSDWTHYYETYMCKNTELDPFWLLKSEDDLLNTLRARGCGAFVDSLGVGMPQKN